MTRAGLFVETCCCALPKEVDAKCLWEDPFPGAESQVCGVRDGTLAKVLKR